MKAIILARVSTEEQLLEGQSIPAQLSRAREYALKKDFSVISEYQFDESSTTDRRAKFETVIEEIEKSKEPIALIVETVDRLQRSFRESVSLDELRREGKLELHFIRENLVIHKDSNSSEIQRWDIAVFVAKSYVLQISDNVKRTFNQKVQKGEITGKAPVGYINTEDEQGKKTVVTDPIKADFIVKIFQLYATGNYSMQSTAKIMTEEWGFRSPKASKPLKARQIESILKNPFYYGEQVCKGQLYPHKYEPLISYNLFVKCKEVRERYNKTPHKNAGKPYIFKGLVKCAKCGCRITPEIHKGKYIYYSCTNHKNICKREWIPERFLFDPVKGVLEGLKLSQHQIDEIVGDLKRTEKAKNSFHQQELINLRDEYDAIDNRISVMYEDRLDGRITTEDYDKKFREYKDKQQQLLVKIKSYDNANTNYYTTANQVLSLAQRATEIFESSEIEEKRQLLQFVFQNLELNGKNLVYKLKTPFDTVLLAGATPNSATWGG